jgi:MFS family permease
VLASPTFVLVLLAPGFVSAAALLIVPVFFSSIIFGPSYAAVQTLVSPGARATAAAILLFILTLIGLGLGPLAIGLLSDVFGRWMGSAEGLRWALLMTAPANLLAGAGYWMASRTLNDELELD